ncbi:hypothetical protein F4802DRAFT_586964 [Xylaria palmicola]|nr:hypothetical protein F4802DRAFT_586964 [Xylaria palmicola]
MAQTRAQTAAKRGHDLGDECQDTRARKRQRQLPGPYNELSQGHRSRDQHHNEAIEGIPDLGPNQAPPVEDDDADSDDPIDVWRRQGHWPRRYFEPDMEYQPLLARKRPIRGRKRSNSATSMTPSNYTPSDQSAREKKSAQYQDQRYETVLATMDVFMGKPGVDVTQESKVLCKRLLRTKQTPPKDTLFRDDIFGLTCEKIRLRNEARVIQDISRLLVPSAESLATYGAKHLENLVESVNEGWNNSVPLTGSRPQPDYSVGFRREAFTHEQLQKLSPFIGNFLTDQSFFMATYYMYFPFLACEVKCGAAALNVADRQNTHSITMAVRAIVELYRLVGLESTIHRKILAFSVAHDNELVRIYGYYPVINQKQTLYYRYSIRSYSFMDMDGKDKWAAYQFTKNIYDNWVPGHFKSICEAIDKLPSNINFEVESIVSPSHNAENSAVL